MVALNSILLILQSDTNVVTAQRLQTEVAPE